MAKYSPSNHFLIAALFVKLKKHLVFGIFTKTQDYSSKSKFVKSKKIGGVWQ